MQKNHWANNKPLLHSDPSIKENYTVKNMIDGKEVLIYVTKEELETMDDQGKINFLKRFTFSNGSLMNFLVVNYVDKKCSFYVSGIPNIENGTFHIVNVSDSFAELNDRKYHDKIITFTERSIISFLMIGCAFMSFKIGKTLK